MSRATYDSVFAIVFLRKKKYTFLKAFYITEILALAIVRTLDIQLSVETEQFALQSTVVILLRVAAGWLGPRSLQILVWSTGRVKTSRKKTWVRNNSCCFPSSFPPLLLCTKADPVFFSSPQRTLLASVWTLLL